jgi:hypothetical protein
MLSLSRVTNISRSWIGKSDLSPSRDDRSGHIAQLKDYISTIGAAKGAIVYMSLGEVVWVQPGPAASIA